MGDEDSVKNQDQERFRSLWEILQSPVRDTVWARSLADRQTPDGFLNLLRMNRLLESVSFYSGRVLLAWSAIG